MRYYFEKVRQVLRNPLLLDFFGLGSLGLCLLTPALLSIQLPFRHKKSISVSCVYDHDGVSNHNLNFILSTY